jgi:hypothetical protein
LPDVPTHAFECRAVKDFAALVSNQVKDKLRCKSTPKRQPATVEILVVISPGEEKRNEGNAQDLEHF